MKAVLQVRELETRLVPAVAIDSAYETYAWVLINNLRADPEAFANNLHGLRMGTVASAFGFAKTDPVIADLQSMISRAGVPEHYAQALALMRATANAGPLAWDDLLETRANTHNAWMRTNGFEHTAVNSGNRFAIPGYSKSNSATADTWGYGGQYAAWGENIGYSIGSLTLSKVALDNGTITSAGFQQRAAFLDAVGYMLELSSASLGHLKNLLGRDAGTSTSLPSFNVLGLDLDMYEAPGTYETQDGVAEAGISTQRLALYRPSAGGFITGLAYNDQNHNRFFDVGEGMILTVDVRNSSGGGFTETIIPSQHGAFAGFVANGTYTVTFKSGPVTLGSETVTINNSNAWADFTPQDLGRPTIIGPVGSPTTLRPTMSWSVVENATAYQIRVLNRTTLATELFPGATAANTNWTTPSDLVSGHTYGVQVRALLGSTPGPWSSPKDFQVAMPTLNAPTVGNALKPVFSWSTIARAAGYRLRIDDVTKGLTNIFPGLTFTTTSGQLPGELVSGRDYIFYVRANNGEGLGTRSPGRSFTAMKPAAVGPTMATTVTQLRPTFSWSAVPGAASYQIRVHDVSKNVVNLIQAVAIPGTTYTPETDLVSGRGYSWQVRAVNAAGLGRWTTATGFKVAKPTLTGPSGNITDATPAVSWTAIAGATSYRVKVLDLTTSQTVSYIVPSTNWLPPAKLVIGHRYQLAVAALNASNIGALTLGDVFKIV